MAATESIVVLCTCPKLSDADAIATALLEERLAACVNRLDGIKSTYRWRGRVERDDEVLLLIKSTADRYEQLEATIAKLHPADTPEIIALPIVAGSRDYLDWIAASTS